MLQRKVLDEVRIDILAREVYGAEINGAVEGLLKANFRLADHGGFVPAGDINTPEAPAAEPIDTVNPWE
jgi:P2-like prophage tail protein X